VTGASQNRRRGAVVEQHVVLVVRRHWLVPVGELLAAAPLMLAAVEAIRVVAAHLAGTSEALLQLPSGAVVAAIWVAFPMLRWSWISLTVTDRSVVAMAGLLGRRRIEVPFDQIKTIEFRPSRLGQALGYGTFRIGTATQAAAVCFRQLPLDELRGRLLANAAAHRLRRGRDRHFPRERCLRTGE
jgi:uncharacterized membrane protein YdbT with pleckstrin-like domain